MNKTVLSMASILLLSLVLSSCAVVPVSDSNYSSRCQISSDRKTLKVIDVAKETNSYYSVEGLILTPILIPASALISGTYVAVNNIYNLGEEKIVCKEEAE